MNLPPPTDVHNARWQANARPGDWRNPTPNGRYNLVVFGAGSAGLVCVAGVAGLGGQVAVIEKHMMGGDCLNTGCVPSKALLRPAHLIAELRRAREMGVALSDYRVDFGAVMERVRRLRADISHADSAERFRGLGADVFFGDGRFTGPDTVTVGGQTLRFSKAVIATGSRAAVPPIPGLHETGFLTNENIFNLTERPRRLVVIGGGPIGCEMAQAFQLFGSQVTVVDIAPNILIRDDVDAARVVRAALERDGVQFQLNAKPTRVERVNGEVVIHLENKDSLHAEAVLVATGRAPNVEDLDLDKAGVTLTKQGVSVNDYMQTANPRIYAVGDVAYKYQFTHTADATARIAVTNALFFGRRRASALTVPWVTYTGPELAHVGLTEAEAQARNIAVTPITYYFKDNDRAVADGETEGFLKVLIKRGTDKIVGATIVARRAGDMISEVTLAIVGNIGLAKIAAVIHPYPTQSEGLKKAADAYNRTRLTPRVKRLFTKFLEWRRS